MEKTDMNTKALSHARQWEIVEPCVMSFTEDAPPGVIADKLRDDGYEREANWLLRRKAGYFDGLRKSYAEKIKNEERRSERQRLAADPVWQEQQARERAAAKAAAVTAEAQRLAERQRFLAERAKDTDPDCPYKTIRAALADGFSRQRADDYGGERWKIKGRYFVKATKKALSRTAWRKQGRRVLPYAQPHGEMSFHPGQLVVYDVFREDQTVAF